MVEGLFRVSGGLHLGFGASGFVAIGFRRKGFRVWGFRLTYTCILIECRVLAFGCESLPATPNAVP